jgi:hypothetical protein
MLVLVLQDGGAGSFFADDIIGPTAPSYGTPGPVGSTRYFSGGGGGGNRCVGTAIEELVEMEVVDKVVHQVL